MVIRIPRITIPRLPWNKHWMLMAHFTATRSTCDRGPSLLFDPDRHGVGAVLVRDKRMIAAGYNGSAPGQAHCSDPDEFDVCGGCGTTVNREFVYRISGRGRVTNCLDCGSEKQVKKQHGGHIMRDGHCVRTIHSEMNALMQCALDGVSPVGATLYCTASPCFDCGKAIIRSGINRVYYSQEYESRYGLSREVYELLSNSGVESEVLVITREDIET